MCEGSSEVPEQKVELAGEDGEFHLAPSSLTDLEKRRGGDTEKDECLD